MSCKRIGAISKDVGENTTVEELILALENYLPCLLL